MIGMAAMGPAGVTQAAGAARAATGPKVDWRTVLSGISSALPVLAASRANQQAQEDFLRADAELAETQRQADAMVNEEIGTLATSGPEADTARSLANYSAAVQRNRSAATSAPAPQLSGQARADAKEEGVKGAQYGRSQATFAAGVDAPSRQRERESQSAARTAGDVRGLGQHAGTSAFLARLRANRRVANPWASLVSQLGTQIANNYEPGVR